MRTVRTGVRALLVALVGLVLLRWWRARSPAPADGRPAAGPGPGQRLFDVTLGAAIHRVLALPEEWLASLAGSPRVVDGQQLSPRLALVSAGATPLCTAAARTPSALLRSVVDRAGGATALTHARDAAATDLAIPGANGSTLPARLYDPPDRPEGPGLIVFFHGGGWVMGSIEAHDTFCRFVARRARVKVLSVGYRLAPEHPFPAAVDDASAAFRWAAAQADALGVDRERIAVGGDSAGGNLAAAVALTARSAAEVAPRLAWLVYPIVDARLDDESVKLFGDGLVLERRAMEEMLGHYAATALDRLDPRCSVVDAPVPPDMPPTHIVTAGMDILRDQAERFGERLRAHGVDVYVRRFPDLPHGFMAFLVDPACLRAAGEIVDAVAVDLHAPAVRSQG